eukprot:TRINITY_DN232_c0_g1_i8.p1 TRINITY_DN232_c0_g1~~TRINITY_DN232_c0_g1_i8.p1  ORF type:complete len:126 (+),score=52.25 TRINITY_DN232_c0_g1_i8:2-379(+)
MLYFYLFVFVVFFVFFFLFCFFCVFFFFFFCFSFVVFFFFFFLMIRRPPRSTHCISSAASDVYKRQVSTQSTWGKEGQEIQIERDIWNEFFTQNQLKFQQFMILISFMIEQRLSVQNRKSRTESK